MFGDKLPALFAAAFFLEDILHLLLFSKWEISTMGSEIFDLLLQASLPCLLKYIAKNINLHYNWIQMQLFRLKNSLVAQ